MALKLKFLNYYIHPVKGQLKFQALNPFTERIEILTTGRAWVLHENNYREVQRGDILWHVEGESAIVKSDPQNPYECLNIIFQIKELRQRPHSRINRWHDIDELDLFCQRANKEFREGLIAKDVFDQHIITRIEYQIAKSKVSKNHSEFPLTLKKAIEMIQKNYKNKIMIKDIARDVQLSVTHLHDLFRTHFNISPLQYLLKVRLSYACQKLTVSTDPIKRIADECGFSNANSFSRSFKQHKNLTPDQFRQKYS